ncbi:CinA family protein [Leucobacter luti]|uniref:CinA family protein n=1 Tax=Leucobacter luti TaxID=340320 RepID=UPI003D015021
MSLTARVIEAAAARGIRIAVAESLTGGLLADALVQVPGASRVFSGGIVAYDTALKHSLLGVDPGLLAQRGPVDPEVARQMALGVRRACATPREAGAASEGPLPAGSPVEAELGLATTGVAGPDPDPQSGQLAGTVWIGVSVGDTTRSVELHAAGDRSAIRAAAVAAAIELAAERLGVAPEAGEPGGGTVHDRGKS